MQELEITWRRVIAIAWLIIWRGAIGGALLGALIGFVIGFVIGIVSAAMHVPQDQARSIVLIVTSITGLLFGLTWSCLVVRRALRKQFSDFRLALVPVDFR